jgi:hypothetical protein
MRKLLILAGAAFCFTAMGCSTTYTPSNNLTTNMETIDFTKGYVTGEACGVNILHIIPRGDGSVTAAAKKAGIKTVKYAEHRAAVGLLASQTCTKVYGEK